MARRCSSEEREAEAEAEGDDDDDDGGILDGDDDVR